MEDCKKEVTVKLLKWETIKLMPEDKESVKNFKEKLKAFKGGEASLDQKKIMYTGKVEVHDKKALSGFSRRTAAILMVTNEQTDGSVVYVEWPKDKSDISPRERKLSKLESPLKAGSDVEKPPPDSEPDKKTPPPPPKSETEPPKVESEKENLPPKAKTSLEGSLFKTELEKLAQKLNSEPPKQLREAETKVDGSSQPPSDDEKLTVNNVFDFVGEFVGSGSGEVFNVHKTNKSSFFLSKDKLIKTMKRRLGTVSKLLITIRGIKPLRSKL